MIFVFIGFWEDGWTLWCVMLVWAIGQSLKCSIKLKWSRQDKLCLWYMMLLKKFSNIKTSHINIIVLKHTYIVEHAYIQTEVNYFLKTNILHLCLIVWGAVLHIHCQNTLHSGVELGRLTSQDDQLIKSLKLCLPFFFVTIDVTYAFKTSFILYIILPSSCLFLVIHADVIMFPW